MGSDAGPILRVIARSTRCDLGPPPLLLAILLLSVAAGVLAGFLAAPDLDRSHRYPPPKSPPGVDLTNIAGEYTTDNHRRGSLSILADGRYSFVEGGCTGVSRESGYLRMSHDAYALAPSGRAQPAIDHRFILVRWQSRRYLVPPDKMPDFCDAVANADEPRRDADGTFFLAVPFDRVTGLPELPGDWARRMRERIVAGKITAVAKGGLMQIDLGASSGIKPEDLLTVRRKSREEHRFLRVIAVNEKWSTAEEYCSAPSEEPLEVGREVIAEKAANAGD